MSQGLIQTVCLSPFHYSERLILPHRLPVVLSFLLFLTAVLLTTVRCRACACERFHSLTGGQVIQMTSPGKKRAIPESHYLANPTQRRNIKSSAVIYQLFLALSSYWEFSKYAVLSWVERRLPNDECSSHTCYKYWDPCELAQDTIHEDHSLFKKLPPHLFIGMTGQTLLLNPCSWRADLL